MDAVPQQHPPKKPVEIKNQRNKNIENIPNEPNINKITIIDSIFEENSDIVITVDVSICNKPVKLLVDSGAHATMLKSSAIKSNILYYPQVKYAMVGINGPSSSITTHGAAYGNVVMNGVKMKTQFQIADSRMHLNYDGILGLDFLRNYNAIINMSKMTLSVTLPPWHNMYEIEERHMFEKSNQNVIKMIKNNVLMYCKNEMKQRSISSNKKSKNLEAHVNRLELLSLHNNNSHSDIKLSPYTTRNLKIDSSNEILCKAKTFSAGVFMTDTIIHAGNSTVTIVNNSDKTVHLTSLEVEMEPISNYNVFSIKKSACDDSERRIKIILDTMDMSHCNDMEKKRIEKLVSEYYDVFYIEGDGLSFAKGAEHRIPTEPNINPINVRQYKTSVGQKEIIQQKIKQMLDDDIIEPSTSLWNFPIILAPKKSSGDQKEFRFCVDYKQLNKHTETQTFPMPNLDEELGRMNGCKYFGKCDIAMAFHQIKMFEGDKDKTAFSTGFQKYQFKRMPFGLKGSPITWQVYLTTIMASVIISNVMVYMDDILTYSRSAEGHEATLRKIFEILRINGLKLKIEKTTLFAKEVEYLGHVIGKDGVKPNGRNVEAIKECPRPKKLAEVQRFLGMASYFRKFIFQFAAKAQPLHRLCKKNVEFEWSESCQKAFDTLKNALTTAPVLAFPDYSRKFYISVDASFYAVGGYISNDPPPNDKPIEYFSKALSDTQKNYATTHKELLAIILAIERFQHFIWGKHFVLYTDHEALTYLFNQNKVGSRLLRWKLQLAEYDFDIIHRKGSQNVVSDCLSRFEPTQSINFFRLIKNPTTSALCQAMTRSRAIERDAGQENKQNKSHHIHEEPSITFDAKKYDKIIFIIDDVKNICFKKLQSHIRKKLDMNALAMYSVHSIGDGMHVIKLPLRFDSIAMETTIASLIAESKQEHTQRMAINCGISNYRTYLEIKTQFRALLCGSEISVTFHICKQVEINDVQDINEILKTYHTSLLGAHRGFERMKNTIKNFYTWPTMSADIRKYIENCAICERTKVHTHTHTPLQITSVAHKPFEKLYIDFVGEINPNSLEGHKYILTVSCDLTKYVIMKPTFDQTALTAARTIVDEVCLVYNFPKIMVSDNGPAFIAETFAQMAKLLEIRHIKTAPYHPQSNGGIERYHRTLGSYVRAYAQKQASNWHKFIPYFAFSYNSTVHTTTGYAPHTLVFGFDIELPVSTKKARINYNYDSYHNELLSQMKHMHECARELIQKRKLENKKIYDKRGVKTLNLKRNDLVLLLNDTKAGKFDDKYTGPFRVEEPVSPAITKIKKKNKSVIVHNDKLKLAKADYGARAPPML